MDKKVFKIFPGFERNNVKKFLEKMFLKGYKLVKIKRNNYYFEKVKPASVIYEFDFQTLKAEEEKEYLSFETNWNFAAKRGANYWFYTLKIDNANQVTFFNNNESKINFLEKHLKMSIIATSFMILNCIILLTNSYIIFNYFGYFSIILVVYNGFIVEKYYKELKQVKNDILE